MLSAYMKAGYMPQIGCRLDVALAWVASRYDLPARIAEDKTTIEVEIAPNLWAPSDYYFENDLCLKRRTEDDNQ